MAMKIKDPRFWRNMTIKLGLIFAIFFFLANIRLFIIDLQTIKDHPWGYSFWDRDRDSSDKREIYAFIFVNGVCVFGCIYLIFNKKEDL